MMRQIFSNTRMTLILMVLAVLAAFLLPMGDTSRGSAAALVASQSVPQSSSAKSDENAAQKYFTDVELTNQNGQKMRLYSDLLKGKVVVINTFFATCPGSCLPLMRNMEKLQTALGDKVGNEVHLISISVDPTVDTPERLKGFASKVGSKPGWFLLSGNKPDVDFALRKLGQYVDKKEAHLNIFIIGNERTGLWKKAFGLARSEELLRVVESVLNDKQ